MKATTSICHRKTLIENDFDNNAISSIVSRSRAFEKLKRQQGYATKYNFGEVLVLSIGCGLLKIGLPFRYVDDILYKISGKYIEKLIKLQKRVMMEKAVMCLKPRNIGVDDDKAIYLDDEEGFIPVFYTDEKTGNRIAPLSIVTRSSKSLSKIDEIPDEEFIVLKLYEYFDQIYRLAKKENV